jgi:hypothetical protein
VPILSLTRLHFQTTRSIGLLGVTEASQKMDLSEKSLFMKMLGVPFAMA